jgi:hypothetical protein
VVVSRQNCTYVLAFGVRQEVQQLVVVSRQNCTYALAFGVRQEVRQEAQLAEGSSVERQEGQLPESEERRSARYVEVEVDLEALDLTEDLVQASTWFGLADVF